MNAAVRPLACEVPDRLVWLDAYDSGNALIDSQHRRMFGIVNALFVEVAAGVTPRVLELLDDLIMHTIDHFRDEESYLERLAFGELEQHRHQHGVLLEKTLTRRHRLNEGDGSYAELLEFLADEVVYGHMLGCDRRYFDLITPR